MGPLTHPLFHFIDLLEKNRIRYALIGGMAITILARERFTRIEERLKKLKRTLSPEEEVLKSRRRRL